MKIRITEARTGRELELSRLPPLLPLCTFMTLMLFGTVHRLRPGSRREAPLHRRRGPLPVLPLLGPRLRLRSRGCWTLSATSSSTALYLRMRMRMETLLPLRRPSATLPAHQPLSSRVDRPADGPHLPRRWGPTRTAQRLWTHGCSRSCGPAGGWARAGRSFF